MRQIKVNGEAISSASIEQERQQLLNDLSLQNSGMANDRLKLMIFDRAKQNVIDHYLFKQEAERRGIEIDDSLVDLQVKTVAERNGGVDTLVKYLTQINETLDDFRGHVKDRLWVDALVEQIYASVQEPKERRLKKYFKEHKEDYSSPEQVEVWQIVKNFRNPIEKQRKMVEIEKISTSIKAGKSFKLMVKQKSDLPQDEGQLGWVQSGKMGADFDAFIFQAEQNSVSEPIAGSNAWYLLLIGEKQLPIQPKFKEVRDEVLQQFWKTERTATLKGILEGLQEKAVIEE